MTRPLNPDELGAKGEKKFGELCLDARLNPNQSDRDRVGWDYVVTWPLVATAAFDSRPAALTCHAQIKTVWEGNDTVSLNLGTLEHIVKDNRPAFIVVLEVDDPGLAFVGARLIHIANDFLAEILKRLRRAYADRKRPNELTFQASASRWGRRLPGATGAAIKAAIEDAVPSGMAEYCREKQRQLTELGYEKGQMSLRTTLEASSLDEVIDGFLGVRPLRLTEARQFDNRFGIPLEASTLPWTERPDEGGAVILFKPAKLDDCSVVAKRDRDDATIEFKAGMFTLPMGIVGPDRLVIEARGKLIRVRIDTDPSDGNASLVFASVPGIENIRATASDWATYYRIGAWAMTERMSFEIRGRKITKMPPIISDLPTPRANDAAGSERAAEAAELVEWALLKAQAPGMKLTSTELLGAANDLAIVRSIEQAPETVSPLTFTTAGPALKSPQPSYEMLYLNSIALGRSEIAYAARTRMTVTTEGEGYRWVSGRLQLAHVRKIKPVGDNFRKFVREALKLTGVQNFFGPGNLE
jgi:hypothetical protein